MLSFNTHLCYYQTEEFIREPSLGSNLKWIMLCFLQEFTDPVAYDLTPYIIKAPNTALLKASHLP